MLLEAAMSAGDMVADSLYPAARRLVGRHVEAGHFCVILSAAPQELVSVVSTRLGAQLAVGSRAGVRDGRLTGQMDGPFCYGEGKLVRLATELGAVDFDRSYAYADSLSDLPLLAACGRPVAVNPDRGLRRIAQHGGWPILQFRKRDAPHPDGRSSRTDAQNLLGRWLMFNPSSVEVHLRSIGCARPGRPLGN
jgi:phosphoserine phosphatase